MACVVMAYLVMAYIVMAYIVMAYIVIAYIVMAYIVMASIGRRGILCPRGRSSMPRQLQPVHRVRWQRL